MQNGRTVRTAKYAKTARHRFAARNPQPATRNSIAVLCLCVLVVSSALGQVGAVNGFVRDASDGEPLAYCNVYLDKTEFGAATNDKGYYVIGHVPPGKYELVASFIGYKNETRSVTVGPGQTVNADLELSPGAIEVGEVKISADRARFEREVEVSAVRLETKQFQFIPKVGGEVDLFRTIQLLPGVIATSDFSNRLYIRGGSPDQNLILLDGITVYNPSHLFGLFSPFIAEAVSDVTLLAGGFPAKYGGRLSSVLDERGECEAVHRRRVGVGDSGAGAGRGTNPRSEVRRSKFGCPLTPTLSPTGRGKERGGFYLSDEGQRTRDERRSGKSE